MHAFSNLVRFILRFCSICLLAYVPAAAASARTLPCPALVYLLRVETTTGGRREEDGDLPARREVREGVPRRGERRHPLPPRG